MKKRETFETKYPYLVDCIEDDYTRHRFMINNLTYECYKRHEYLLKYFIIELNYYFDNKMIAKIINEMFFKYPENLMVSFISAYLNSRISIKKSSDILDIFAKMMELDNLKFKYVEDNGLENIDKANLDEELLNEKFFELNIDLEFKDNKLDFLWQFLSDDEKYLLISILDNNCFDNFKLLLEDSSFSLKRILSSLCKYKIKYNLFLDQNIENITDRYTKLIVLSTICLDNCEDLFEMQFLLSREEYSEIKKIVTLILFPKLSIIGKDKSLIKNCS